MEVCGCGDTQREWEPATGGIQGQGSWPVGHLRGTLGGRDLAGDGPHLIPEGGWQPASWRGVVYQASGLGALAE